MKQISVKLKNNKPGEIFKMCDALGKRGINIVSLFGGGEEGTFKIITNDEATTLKAISHIDGTAKVNEIYTAKLSDKPGELAKLTAKLTHAGVNISCLSVISKDETGVTVGMEVDNLEKAKGIK